MHRFFITIDGGTTNTRAVLWKGDEVIAKAARQVGAQDTAVSSGNQALKEAVRNYLNYEDAYAATVASNLNIPTLDSSVTAGIYAETAVLYRNELDELLEK